MHGLHITRLPHDLLVEVFLKLPVRDLVALPLICRLFQKTCESIIIPCYSSGFRGDRELLPILKRFRGFRELDLSNSLVTNDLVVQIPGMQILQAICLRRCRHLSMDDRLFTVFLKATSLKRLSMSFASSNDAGTVEVAVRKLGESCPKLRVLRLSYPCQMPLEVLRLSGLTHLVFTSVEMESIPDEFGQLENLVHLSLSGSFALKRLPTSICSLAHLKELILALCCLLEELPKEMGSLTKLEYLNLAGCESLESLPESVGSLENLHTLILDSCLRIREIPETITVKVSKLTHLNLRFCKYLPRVPELIGNLKTLSKLILANCFSLDSIPSSIGKLTSLTTLDLRRTAIKEIPQSIGNLLHLTDLYLDACSDLRCLPVEIRKLINLKVLRIVDCHSLTEVSQEVILGLPNLLFLEDDGCPGTDERQFSDKVSQLTAQRRGIQNNADFPSTKFDHEVAVDDFCSSSISDCIVFRAC